MHREAPSPDDPDAQLMLAFRGGDEGAFAALVHRWQDRVVSLANRYLRSTADAEDLAQEVFLRVHRARETYEPTARFSTWIYRITVNTSLNSLRGRRVRRAIGGAFPDDAAAADPPDPDERPPEAAAEDEELARVLRAILDELPERQRAAILLNKYEGLSYDDTAKAMDLSVVAVKSLLTRARVAIKARLEPYLERGELPPTVTR